MHAPLTSEQIDYIISQLELDKVHPAMINFLKRSLGDLKIESDQMDSSISAIKDSLIPFEHQGSQWLKSIIPPADSNKPTYGLMRPTGQKLFKS